MFVGGSIPRLPSEHLIQRHTHTHNSFKKELWHVNAFFGTKLPLAGLKFLLNALIFSVAKKNINNVAVTENGEFWRNKSPRTAIERQLALVYIQRTV